MGFVLCFATRVSYLHVCILPRTAIDFDQNNQKQIGDNSYLFSFRLTTGSNDAVKKKHTKKKTVSASRLVGTKTCWFVTGRGFESAQGYSFPLLDGDVFLVLRNLHPKILFSKTFHPSRNYMLD